MRKWASLIQHHHHPFLRLQFSGVQLNTSTIPQNCTRENGITYTTSLTPILACVISRYVVENLHYPQNCIRKKKLTHSTPLKPILRMCFPGMLLNTINNLHYHKIAHAKMSCTNTRLLKCFQCLYLASVSHSCVHFLKKNFSLS